MIKENEKENTEERDRDRGREAGGVFRVARSPRGESSAKVRVMEQQRA